MNSVHHASWVHQKIKKLHIFQDCPFVKCSLALIKIDKLRLTEKYELLQILEKIIFDALEEKVNIF